MVQIKTNSQYLIGNNKHSDHSQQIISKQPPHMFALEYILEQGIFHPPICLQFLKLVPPVQPKAGYQYRGTVLIYGHASSLMKEFIQVTLLVSTPVTNLLSWSILLNYWIYLQFDSGSYKPQQHYFGYLSKGLIQILSKSSGANCFSNCWMYSDPFIFLQGEKTTQTRTPASFALRRFCKLQEFSLEGSVYVSYRLRMMLAWPCDLQHIQKEVGRFPSSSQVKREAAELIKIKSMKVTVDVFIQVKIQFLPNLIINISSFQVLVFQSRVRPINWLLQNFLELGYSCLIDNSFNFLNCNNLNFFRYLSEFLNLNKFLYNYHLDLGQLLPNQKLSSVSQLSFNLNKLWKFVIYHNNVFNDRYYFYFLNLGLNYLNFLLNQFNWFCSKFRIVCIFRNFNPKLDLFNNLLELIFNHQLFCFLLDEQQFLYYFFKYNNLLLIAFDLLPQQLSDITTSLNTITYFSTSLGTTFMAWIITSTNLRTLTIRQILFKIGTQISRMTLLYGCLFSCC